MVDGLAPVSFQRGELHLVVRNVPARVCPGCGEAYVDEEVALSLLQRAEQIYQAGVLDGVIDYEGFALK